jgi:multiple sugar transport system permease protein
MKRPARALSLLLHGALLVWLLLACLPIVWTAVISLRQYVDAFSVPVKWLAPVTFENYSRLWIDKAFYRNFLNTAIVTAGTVVISISIGASVTSVLRISSKTIASSDPFTGSWY